MASNTQTGQRGEDRQGHCFKEACGDLYTPNAKPAPLFRINYHQLSQPF